jgi:hypothetical protein
MLHAFPTNRVKLVAHTPTTILILGTEGYKRPVVDTVF